MEVHMTSRASEAAGGYGKKRRTRVNKSLAPDGLPWPEGYFDCPPRITLNDAIRRRGVRPSKYFKGMPLYTDADRQNPGYISPYPSEPEWADELMKIHGISNE
jgi:hypothetical protein